MGFAARVTDMHICPMSTPTTPPVPHVGGPILPPGSVQVTIGGLPAACVGDSCLCSGAAGLNDPIAKGSTTVKIGGKFAARQGDLTGHGGTIQGFCPTVIIGG
jgi:uncharacterized Zn-binding protein involved in type VI secretion